MGSMENGNENDNCMYKHFNNVYKYVLWGFVPGLAVEGEEEGLACRAAT